MDYQHVKVSSNLLSRILDRYAKDGWNLSGMSTNDAGDVYSLCFQYHQLGI